MDCKKVGVKHGLNCEISLYYIFLIFCKCPSLIFLLQFNLKLQATEKFYKRILKQRQHTKH